MAKSGFLADTDDIKTPLKAKDDDDLLVAIREQFDRAQEAVDYIHEEEADDLAFYALDQWDNEDKKAREALGRPCLTVDHIGPQVRQVTGDIRMNKPSIKVRPVDDNADPQIAELYTGLIRNIEQQSVATNAYVKAAENAAVCGEGAFRILTVYADDDSFEQDIRIERITNALSVVWDEDAEKQTREDARYCFVVTQYSKEAFEEKWPDASLTSFQAENRETWVTRWYQGNDIKVAEYFYKKPKTKRLWRMYDGTVLDVTDEPEPRKAAIQQMQDELFASRGEPAPQIQEREVESHEIHRCVVNGAEILEGPDLWPGRYIPIIPVFGEEIHVGDDLRRRGMVRAAKDPQRMINYHESAAVEVVSLTPKSPYIGTIKHFENLEEQWEAANRDNLPYLPYNPDPQAPNAKPQREAPAQVPAALLALKQSAVENMHAATGIYPSATGGQSNEISGVAIAKRDTQGDVGSFLYVDNLSLAINYAGKQLIDLIPRIYDTDRVVRVLGEDDAEELVPINRVMEDGSIMNDLSAGKYDVVVTTGPSYSTKRQEAAESMREFRRDMPELAGLVADLLVKNEDWPGSDEIVERIRKKLVAQGIVEPDPEKGEQPPPAPPPNPLMIEAENRRMDAETKRLKAMIDADKTQADIAKTYAETRGTRLDNLDQALEMIVSDKLAALVQAQVETQIRALLDQATPYGPNGGGFPPA